MFYAAPKYLSEQNKFEATVIYKENILWGNIYCISIVQKGKHSVNTMYFADYIHDRIQMCSLKINVLIWLTDWLQYRAIQTMTCWKLSTVTLARPSTLRGIILQCRKPYVKRNVNIMKVIRENDLPLVKSRKLTT